MTEKIARLAELVRLTGTTPHLSPRAAGRNAFTRRIDAMTLWIRHHAPPVHRVAAWLFGVGLFGYAWLVARTSQLVTVGATKWPHLPERCVLAVWHDNAPSLLVAIAKAKPHSPLAVMIATEPRGDSLETLCRRLGLRVIRGDWEHHGWQSVAQLAELAAGGARVLITPDGGGPRRLARAGVLVLAAAAGAPLVAIGANCRPALGEPHKWDRPRNPVPFGRVAVSIEPPLQFSDFEDAAAMESARLGLEQALNEASRKARGALGLAEEK